MTFQDNTHFPKGRNDFICEVMPSFVLVNRKDADHLVKTFVMKKNHVEYWLRNVFEGAGTFIQ